MEHTHTESSPWWHTLWSAIALFCIPSLVTLLVSVGNGVVVGFQTRGDSAATDQVVATLGAMSWFQAFPFVLVVLVAIWRSTARQDISRTTALGAAVLAALLAALLATLLVLAMNVIAGRDVAATLPCAALWFSIAAVTGGLTVMLRGQRVPSVA